MEESDVGELRRRTSGLERGWTLASLGRLFKGPDNRGKNWGASDLGSRLKVKCEEIEGGEALVRRELIGRDIGTTGAPRLNGVRPGPK